MKDWGRAVHLQENGSEQVELSPADENVIKESALRLGLGYQ